MLTCAKLYGSFVLVCEKVTAKNCSKGDMAFAKETGKDQVLHFPTQAEDW
jgi:hypothetical protein